MILPSAQCTIYQSFFIASFFKKMKSMLQIRIIFNRVQLNKFPGVIFNYFIFIIIYRIKIPYRHKIFIAV